MISSRELLLSLVLPVAWAAMWLTAAIFSRRAKVVCVGVAVLGSYVIAHVGLFGWPTFPPTPARHGIAWAGVVGLVGGAAIGFARGRAMRAWLVRAACVSAGMVLVGWSRFGLERAWTAFECVWFVVVWAGATAMWWMIDSVAGPSEGGSTRMPRDGWIIASSVAGLSAPVVVLVGSAVGEGQVLGALASALMVGALVAMLPRGPSMGSVGAGVAVMIAAMVWFDAMLWATLPAWMVVGFCAAPAAGFVSDALLFRSRPPWIRSVVRVSAVSGVMMAVGGMSAVREWMALSGEFGM